MGEDAETPNDGQLRMKSAELAELCGISVRQTDEILREAGTQALGWARGSQGYKVTEAVSAICAYFRRKIEKMEDKTEANADRRRRDKAQADIAEMEREKMSGTLVDMEEARKAIREKFVAAREKIKTLSLTPEQKKAICEVIANA